MSVAWLASFFAIGCGITVLVPEGTTHGTTSGAGGDIGGGAGGGETTSTMSATASTETVPNGCSFACSVPPANQTCTCTQSCDSAFSPAGKVSCAPIVDLQGTYKIECVCTIGNDFSGVCFEKDEAALCDFEDGCCAKYFSGK